MMTAIKTYCLIAIKTHQKDAKLCLELKTERLRVGVLASDCQQFPPLCLPSHLQNGQNDGVYLLSFPWVLNQLTYVLLLEQFLVQSDSINCKHFH